MQHSILVSVIIPTYNYAHFISEAIESVLQSNFPQSEIEIIVIDDGSTDDTFNKIKIYKDKVKYHFQTNQGKAEATRAGIGNAKGKYVFNLDADDLFLPDKIQNVVKIFESDNEICHVAHPAVCWNIDINTREIEKISKDILEHKIWGKDLLSYFYTRRILFGGGSTFAARSDVLKDLNIPKAVDMWIDEYLVLMILNQGYSYFINQPLSVWRIHGKNFSNSPPSPQSIEAKTFRSKKSVEAVFDSILKSDFSKEIKKLYLLNIMVSEIALKESLNTKSVFDIWNLWIFLLKNFAGKDLPLIIKCYTVLNRSLPTPIFKALKKLKK